MKTVARHREKSRLAAVLSTRGWTGLAARRSATSTACYRRCLCWMLVLRLLRTAGCCGIGSVQMNVGEP